MNKFWPVVTAALIIGLSAAFLSFNGSKNLLTVSDLETECRYDRGEDVFIGLAEGNRLEISGHYPVENTNVDMSYDYSQSQNSIELNVKNSELERPSSFVDACLGSAVYATKTPGLEPGMYEVVVRHNGDTAESRIIKIG